MKNYLLLLSLLTFSVNVLPLKTLAVEPQTPPKLTDPGKVLRPFLKTGSRGDTVFELQATLKLLGFYAGAVNGVYDTSTANAVSKFQVAAGLKPNGSVGQETWNRLFPPLPPNQSATITASVSGTNFPNPAVTPKNIPNNSTNIVVKKPAINTTAAKPVSVKPQVIAAKPVSVKPQVIVAKPQTAENAKITPVALPVLKIGTQGAAVIKLQERLRSLGYFNGPISGFFGPTTEAAVKVAQAKFKLNPDGVVGAATWNILLP